MATTTITHIIVMPNDLDVLNTTIFQGFSKEYFDDFYKIFSSFLAIPHDVLELVPDIEATTKSKLVGSSLDINLINEDLLDSSHIDFNNFFTFIWSTKKTFSQAKRIVDRFLIKPIHVSCKKSPESIHIQELDQEIILEEISRRKHLVEEKYPSKEFTQQLEKVKLGRKLKKKLPFKPLNHSCVVPSVNALKVCGYDFLENKKAFVSANTNDYKKGIVEAASMIDNIRSEYDIPERAIKNDAILYCASIYAMYYKSSAKIWKNLEPKATKIEMRFVREAIIQNKGYSNFLFETDDNKKPFNPYEYEVVKMLLMDRQYELFQFNVIISIIAANQFCPAIRLPHAVMMHYFRIKHISDLLNAASHDQKKTLRRLNNKLKKYNRVLKEDIGENLLEISFNNRKKILAVCDFPVEWISIDSFPVMFTHEFSRIPATPGNMLQVNALRGQRVLVPYDAFTDILVIRSFNDDDPIKYLLSKAFDIYDKRSLYENLKITIVDVKNAEDMIEALDNFNGLITIFDCHGGHGGETGHAWLEIGNEQFDVWSLVNKCRIPPIVILSACSTHPVEGSHASVANGFFRCGVFSVLGTYGPVDAIHASQFVARLLYRISIFLPMLLEFGAISWREVISGFLRASYVTDVLKGMMDNLKLINDDQYMTISAKSNEVINIPFGHYTKSSPSKKWQDEFVKLIESNTGLSEVEIKKVLDDHFQFVETMLYSQLGRPENIFITKGVE